MKCTAARKTDPPGIEVTVRLDTNEAKVVNSAMPRWIAVHPSASFSTIFMMVGQRLRGNVGGNHSSDSRPMTYWFSEQGLRQNKISTPQEAEQLIGKIFRSCLEELRRY